MEPRGPPPLRCAPPAHCGPQEGIPGKPATPAHWFPRLFGCPHATSPSPIANTVGRNVNNVVINFGKNVDNVVSNIGKNVDNVVINIAKNVDSVVINIGKKVDNVVIKSIINL